MNQQPHSHRSEEIFNLARTIPNQEKRNKYLDQVCSKDSETRREVEELLELYLEDRSFLESPPPPFQKNPEGSSTNLGPSKTVGPYKILECIGEGGMGNVYMAEQSEPIKRRVALKLIKSGLDSKSVIARFEAERQALALMDHPNIAKFYDAGLSNEDRPYFAMELIKGRPLMQYCRQFKLNLKEKLELFQQICLGTQHAHQKGVIHRDLKPSNVLVARFDDRPVAKIIDFGVAKAIGNNLTDKTMFTRFGQLVGTLEYMSPEQAQMNQLDIDTRSDVYALGTILYEMLTETPPFEKEQLGGAALEEILRILREEDPEKPSTRLSRLSSNENQATDVTLERNSNSKPLPPDLDWVVMKAMNKDRACRYAAPHELAADIDRFLRNEPVAASPPSSIYRFKKFVRRHRTSVAVVFTVVVMACSASVVSTLLMMRAFDAEREAKEAESKLKSALAESRANEKRANQRLDQIENGAELLATILDDINPDKAQIGSEPLYERLARRARTAAKKLESNLIADPITESKLQTLLGNTLISLGESELAVEILESALSTRKSELGATNEDTITTQRFLAIAYLKIGEMEKSISLYEEVYDLAKSELGPNSTEVASIMKGLAWAYWRAGERVRARETVDLAMLERAWKLDCDEHHSTSLEALSSQQTLAVMYLIFGNTERAIELGEQVLEGRTKLLPASHTLTLETMSNLGLAHIENGNPKHAVQILEKALTASEQSLAKSHPINLTIRGNLAGAWLMIGKPDLAIEHFESTLKSRQESLSPNHSEIADNLYNLACAYEDFGKPRKAIEHFRTAYSIMLEAYPEAHPHTLSCLNRLARAQWKAGRIGRATILFEKLKVLAEDKLGPDDTEYLRYIGNLGVCYRDKGRFDEAIPLLRRAFAGAGENKELITFGATLADLLFQLGRIKRSIPVYEKWHELSKHHLGVDDPSTFKSKNDLARAYWKNNQLDKSIPMFEELVADGELKFGPGHVETLTYIGNLAVNRKDNGQLDEAIPKLEDVFAFVIKYPRLGWVERQLMDAYIKAGQPQKLTELTRVLVKRDRVKFAKNKKGLANNLGIYSDHLCRAREYKEAKLLLTECMSLFESISPNIPPALQSRVQLGQVLFDLNDYDRAEETLVAALKNLEKAGTELSAPPEFGLNLKKQSINLLLRIAKLKSDVEKQAEWNRQLENLRKN